MKAGYAAVLLIVILLLAGPAAVAADQRQSLLPPTAQNTVCPLAARIECAAAVFQKFSGACLAPCPKKHATVEGHWACVDACMTEHCLREAGC